MDNKKTVLGLALLAFTGWGAFWLKAKQAPVTVEKTVFVDKIVYQDRVVNKNVVRTETRPDGTKIVTEDRSQAQTRTDTHEVKKQTTTSEYHEKTKYSLGLAFGRELGLDLITKPTIYRLEIGYRLWESPLWLTATAGTDKTFLLGIRADF